MKKNLIITSIVVIICVIGYNVVASRATSSSASPSKSESREQREQKRASRQAAFERSIDSMILSRSFTFSPTTMQQEVAGGMRTLQNPNFGVTVWSGGMVEVFLPYIKGYVPPYHYVTLNYTLSSVENYTTEQTTDGWHVGFSTSLFSTGTYHFIFDVSARYGSATLTIKNAWYNDVTYTGSINQY